MGAFKNLQEEQALWKYLMIKPILTCDSCKTSSGHLEEKLACETQKNNVADRTDAVSKNGSRNKCTVGSL